MKFFPKLLAIFIYTSGCPSLAGEEKIPGELASLTENYERVASKNQANFQKKLEDLKTNYLGRLEKFPQLLADVKAEIARIKKGDTTPAPDVGGSLVKLQAQYESARRSMSEDLARKNVALDKKFVDLLENLKSKFEGAGDTAAAAAVATRLDKIAPDRPPVTSAKVKPEPAPAPVGEWPKSIATDTGFEVEVVKEDKTGKTFIYRTPHFQFQADARLRVNLVREFSRIFEATFYALNQLPLQLDLRPPKEGHFKTLLFEHERDYFEAGGPAGSAGVYMGRQRLIMIPLENLGVKKVGKGFSSESRSDNHTLIHEITHQVTHEWNLPIWYTEGLAEYMASCRYRKGRFSMTSPGRNMKDYLKAYKGVWDKEFTMNGVDNMLNKTHRQWSSALGGSGGLANYASAGLMTTYFHHADGDGDASSIRSYLQAIRQGVKENEARTTYLIRERSMSEIQSEITKFYRRYQLKLSFSE